MPAATTSSFSRARLQAAVVEHLADFQAGDRPRVGLRPAGVDQHHRRRHRQQHHAGPVVELQVDRDRRDAVHGGRLGPQHEIRQRRLRQPSRPKPPRGDFRIVEADHLHLERLAQLLGQRVLDLLGIVDSRPEVCE